MTGFDPGAPAGDATAIAVQGEPSTPAGRLLVRIIEGATFWAESGWMTFGRRLDLTAGVVGVRATQDEFTDLFAVADLLAKPPDYERRVVLVAEALHGDCVLAWQAIEAIEPDRPVERHEHTAHYGQAHNLVRRLWPELDRQ